MNDWTTRRLLGVVLICLGLAGAGVGVWGFVMSQQLAAEYSDPQIRWELKRHGISDREVRSTTGFIAAIGPIGMLVGSLLLMSGIWLVVSTPNTNSPALTAGPEASAHQRATPSRPQPTPTRRATGVQSGELSLAFAGRTERAVRVASRADPPPRCEACHAELATTCSHCPGCGKALIWT